MRLSVIVEKGPLEQDEYNFHVDYPHVKFCGFTQWQRASKRHKFKAIEIWSRWNGRSNTIAEPIPSQSIKDQAVALAKQELTISNWSK